MDCKHHWIIKREITEKGEDAEIGTCIKCGDTKIFNIFELAYLGGKAKNVRKNSSLTHFIYGKGKKFEDEKV